MSASDWITYEEVARIADELWLQKKPVNITTLSQRLGRGSNATIKKHLATWSKDLDNKLTLPDPITKVIKTLWESLEQQAQAKIKEVQQKAQQETEQLWGKHEQELQQNYRSLNSLNHQLNDLTFAHDQLQDDFLELQNKLETEKQAKISAQEASELANRLLKEHEKASEAQLKQQQQQHDQAVQLLKEQIGQLKAEHQQALQQLKQDYENKLHQVDLQVQDLQLINRKLAQQVQQSEHTVQSQAKELKVIAENYSQLLNKHEALTVNYQELVKSAKEQDKQLAIIQTELSYTQKSEADYKYKYNEAQRELMQSKEQLGKLQEKLDSLTALTERRGTQIGKS